MNAPKRRRMKPQTWDPHPTKPKVVLADMFLTSANVDALGNPVSSRVLVTIYPKGWKKREQEQLN